MCLFWHQPASKKPQRTFTTNKPHATDCLPGFLSLTWSLSGVSERIRRKRAEATCGAQPGSHGPPSFHPHPSHPPYAPGAAGATW